MAKKTKKVVIPGLDIPVNVKDKIEIDQENSIGGTPELKNYQASGDVTRRNRKKKTKSIPIN